MRTDYELYLEDELRKLKAEDIIKQKIINELNVKIEKYKEGRVNTVMFKGVKEGMDN